MTITPTYTTPICICNQTTMQAHKNTHLRKKMISDMSITCQLHHLPSVCDLKMTQHGKTRNSPGPTAPQISQVDSLQQKKSGAGDITPSPMMLNRVNYNR